MNLDEIKLKRLSEAKSGKKSSTKKVRSVPGGAQVYTSEGTVVASYDVDADGKHTFKNIVVEAEKPRTPKFVQHCVAAITADPERLAKIQERKDGSPFGICTAQYKKDKPGLAAAHSQGKHHTVKDYKKALEKLRESVEGHAAQNVRPSVVIFDPNLITESDDASTPTDSIRFAP